MTFWFDVQSAARSLLRRPRIAAIAMFVMALGIGVTAAVFCIVDAVLIRALPYADPQRLVAISVTNPRDPARGESPQVSLTEFQAWRRATTSFASMGAFAYTQLPIEIGRRAYYPVTALVEPQLVSTLGNALAIGTPFDTADALVPEYAVMISHRLWLAAFDGDPHAIGQTVLVDGSRFTVRAVLREGFQFPRSDAAYSRDPVELLVPAAAYPNFPAQATQWLGIARLKGGVGIARAQQELAAVASRLDAASQARITRAIHLVSLSTATTRRSRPAVLLMLALAVVLLIVAATNVMNLLFSRGATRLHEMAIRQAMGSSSRRIVTQLLCESGIVVGVGAVVGIALAAAAANALVRISPIRLPVTGRIGVDGVVAAFTGLVAVVAALLTGAFPAIHVAMRSTEALRNPGTRISGSRAIAGIQRWLCIVQMTLGVALLGAAGVLTRSMQRLSAVDPGFQTDSLLGFSLSVPGNHTMDERKRFYQRALDAIRTLPGVERAGFITFLPPETRSGVFMGLTIAGAPPPPSDAPPRIANTLVTSPGYLETVGIPMARGRAFTSTDDASSQPVIIINEAAARRYFPDRDPIGQHIGTGFDGSEPTREVVGVVRDVHDRGLGQDAIPTVYIPFQQFALMYGAIVVRTHVAPSALVNPIRERLAAIDASIPLTGFETIRDRVSQSLEEPRFYTVLATLCAVMAVLFVALGVYGIVAFSVAARTTEFGVRMAVGARQADILTLVLGQALDMALMSVTFGSVLGFVLARALRSLLFQVQPGDPVTFVGAAAIVVSVMLLASFVPARRASRVSPVAALRYE